MSHVRACTGLIRLVVVRSACYLDRLRNYAVTAFVVHASRPLVALSVQRLAKRASRHTITRATSEMQPSIRRQRDATLAGRTKDG
jgi:hypothetical protein